VEFLVIGIVTALNLIFIKMKFEKKRYEDGIFDLGILALLTVVFGGSFGGLVVGTVTSLVISIYLYSSPPKFVTPLVSKLKTELQEAHKRNMS
jgi:hypothetical protein